MFAATERCSATTVWQDVLIAVNILGDLETSMPVLGDDRQVIY
jgi:hypothetical protein